jgi:hypothetical protein
VLIAHRLGDKTELDNYTGEDGQDILLDPKLDDDMEIELLDHDEKCEKQFEAAQKESEDVLEKATFEELVQSMENYRESLNHQAGINQRAASQAYAHQYDKRHQFGPIVVGQKILKRNMKDAQRKEGFTKPWLGPYTVVEISNNGHTFYVKDKHGHL